MKLLVVDDDFGARGGVAMTLRSLYPEASVHEAESVDAATLSLNEHPDMRLVLLDLNLEHSRGMATLVQVQQWCEASDITPRILVLSAAAEYDETLITQAIDLCATGYIPKGSKFAIFRSALELTLAGSIYIPEQYLRATAARRRTDLAAASAASPEAPSFTPREREVAALLVKGLSYKQIARRLAEPGGTMSDHTVRVHVQRIAWKLRVSDAVDGQQMTAKAAVIAAFAERRLRFE
jgi:DNA-binding NarL/FixJ family response regulator